MTSETVSDNWDNDLRRSRVMNKGRIVTPNMTYWKCPDCEEELHFKSSCSDDIKLQAVIDHKCSPPSDKREQIAKRLHTFSKNLGGEMHTWELSHQQTYLNEADQILKLMEK